MDVPEEAGTVEEMWDKLKVQREEPERWRRITEKGEVEGVLVEWCAKHFAQSTETPLA